MRRDKTRDLSRSQKTISYYPELNGEVDPRPKERYRYFELLQSHMLIETVGTHIIPTGGRSRKKPIRIDVAPASRTVQTLVASALSRDHGWHAELPSAVAEFVSECAQSVMAFGESVYEIVYLSDTTAQTIVAFELVRVQPFSVRRRLGRLVQVVPREVVNRRGVSPFIDLPADCILIFKPPMGIQDSLAKSLESLAVLSEKLMPEFALKNFREATSKFHYDSTGQVYSQKLALAEAGKAIGWNARGLFEDDMLEFYSLRRQLSFERFNIDFRTAILETLNEGLVLAGNQMGFEAQISIEGLPTVSDVELAQSELESGTKAFGEILKPFLIY
jgi:hypothetical protein